MLSSHEDMIAIKTIHERYRFKQKLGSGGFSDVFRAVQIDTGKEVAIKILQVQSGSSAVEAERRKARFRREMTLNRELDHPNIVKIIESGETQAGLLFIVFDYIAGITLAQLIKKNQALTIPRTINLMSQILAGLARAHEKGIIHRDLKPENIIIVQNESPETVKILDFGISTFIAGKWGNRTRLTLTQEFLGTPAYAAPEQLRGDPVSIKTDLYSWGLIFLECLTGKSPFDSKSVAHIVQQQLSPDPIRIPPLLANHRLGVLLRWVLEKDHNRRAGNSSNVVNRLKKISLDDFSGTGEYLSEQEPSPDRIKDEKLVIYETLRVSQERRQITVLCFSLFIEGKYETIGAEILDEIYHDLLEVCAEKSKTLGGHVVGSMGDRIMVYFGFPDADDTNARRASRVALELSALITRRSAILSKQHGFQLTCQIGLHTGMVTVHAKPGEKKRVIGITPNLAGKLCNITPPNTIYMSHASYNLAKDFVESEPVAKPKSQLSLPFRSIHQVVGERRIEGLVGLIEAKGSKFIGRENAFQVLLQAWNDKGQKAAHKSFLIQGEAGIGKSRFAAEFGLTLQNQNYSWCECRCTPEGQHSALYPILEFLDDFFGLKKLTDNSAAMQVLEEKFRYYGMDPNQTIPLICPWLGLTNVSYPLPEFSPQKQKTMLLSDIATLMVKISKISQVVFMIEDLHWADPTTLEFLDIFIEKINKEKLFLLMSARPVFISPWKKKAVIPIILKGLDDRAIEKIIRDNASVTNLTSDIITQMVIRADGVPLFAEELARMTGEQEASHDTTQDISMDKVIVEIPQSLRDLLTGRLDRLGPAKETAQLAAALGRIFSYDIIMKVSLQDEATILADLDQLVSAGLIHLRHRVGNPEYIFHHALVRDIAYDNLLKKEKIDIHKRIALTLEKEFEQICKNQPEVLAHHWSRAENYEEASYYGLQSATRYQEKSLFSEAILHATRSIEWIQEITEDTLKVERELQFLQLLIPSYISTKGFAAPELDQINNRTDELRQKLPKDSPFLTSILWGKVIYYQTTPDYKKLAIYLEEALNFGEKTANADLLAALYSTVKGHLGWSHATFKESVKYCDIGLEHYKNKKLPSHGRIFGHDSKVLALGVKALSLTIYGDIYRASVNMDEAIEFATLIKDTTSKGLALVYQLCILHERNEKNVIGSYCDSFKEYINKYGLGLWSNVLNLYYSWATNDVTQAKQCLDILQILGLGQLAPYWNFIAAQSEYETGLYDDCVQRLDKYLDHSYRLGELHYVPELYRLKALCFNQMNPQNVQDIMLNFQKAFDFADKIEAHLFKLRSLLDCLQTITDGQTQKECLKQLRQTINTFEQFPHYQKHFEVQKALALIGENDI